MNLLTKKKTILKKPSSFVSVKQRVVASFTAVVMLLQICLPTVVWAASLLSNESITVAMAAPTFQKSVSNAYLYQQASFDDASHIGSQNITSFRERLVAEKINLGQPTFVPIASGITIFIPTYPTGKLIGDAYVQSRYIRQQVFDLLGRHLIYAASSNTSEVAQINQLYDSAFIFAKANPTINFGDNLNATTLAGLTVDMIWPERRVINNESVVVPIVYLKTSTINANKVTSTKTEFVGSAVNLGSISLNHAELTLGANTIVKTAGNLTATKEALIASGGDINLVVGGTLNLIGSKITGVKDVNILANEVNVKTVLLPFQDRYGSGTTLGSIASINSRTGSIRVSSNGNINFEGSSATASNGSITLRAANNISIKPVFTSYQRTYQEGHWQVSASSLDVVGSRLSAQEKIKLVASGAIHITASDLVSTQGGIEILAGLGIYIADEQGNFQSNRVDKMGKTTGTGSDFESFAIRTVLSAGKEILLATTSGDVELKGAKITSTEGTQVKAANGKVRLLVTKENSQHYLDTVRKGTWTIKTVHEEYLKETGIPNAIVGGLAVEALAGVDIEYAGREGATLAEQMAEYKKMPDTKWMADVYEGRTLFKNAQGNLVPLNQVVDFAKVDLAYKYVREHNTNLSPAAMAIIAICVAVAMGPAGAGWLGSGTNAIGAATLNGVTVINAAAMQAGALTLATSAAQNIAAGKGLEDTLKAMTTDDALKNLAISMATAGALSKLGDMKLELFTDAPVGSGLDLANQAYRAVTNSVVTAGISVAINGGNSDDFKKAFTQSLITSAINTLGEKMANKIGQLADGPSPKIDEAMRYIAHAGLGCAIGVASGRAGDPDSDVGTNCASGAGGAVIGELIAQEYKKEMMSPAEQELVGWLESKGVYSEDRYFSMSEVEKSDFVKLVASSGVSASEISTLRAKGIDIAKLGAALGAFIAKADVNIAASTGQNAAENNALSFLGLCSAIITGILTAMVIDEAIETIKKFEVEYSKAQTVAEKDAVVVKMAKAAGVDLTINIALGLTGTKLIELVIKQAKSPWVKDALQRIYKKETGEKFNDTDGEMVGHDVVMLTNVWITPKGLKEFLKDNQIPLLNGWDADRLFKEVLSKPKGERPDPSKYLPAGYIASQLAKFDSGVVRITSKSKLEAEGKFYAGNEGFAIPKSEWDRLYSESGGDLKIISQRLGRNTTLDPKNDVVTFFERKNIPNLRLANGNEAPGNPSYGANQLWVPGAKTIQGVTEAVFVVPKGTAYSIISFN